MRHFDEGGNAAAEYTCLPLLVLDVCFADMCPKEYRREDAVPWISCTSTEHSDNSKHKLSMTDAYSTIRAQICHCSSNLDQIVCLSRQRGSAPSITQTVSVDI